MEYKTLTFDNSPRGRKIMDDSINSYAVTGWTLNSATVQIGRPSLAFGILSNRRKKDKIIVILERNM